MTVELFQCDAIAARLTRSSCAKQWERANEGEPEVRRSNRMAMTIEPRGECVGCPIGKAHHRGERPDVPLVEPSRGLPPLPKKPAVQVVDPHAPPSEAPAARREQDPPTGERGPVEREQEARMPGGQRKKCVECGKGYVATGNKQKRCDECRGTPSRAGGRPSARRSAPKRKPPRPTAGDAGQDAIDTVCQAIDERETEVLEMKRAANRLAEILGAAEPYDLGGA